MAGHLFSLDLGTSGSATLHHRPKFWSLFHQGHILLELVKGSMTPASRASRAKAVVAFFPDIDEWFCKAVRRCLLLSFLSNDVCSSADRLHFPILAGYRSSQIIFNQRLLFPTSFTKNQLSTT